MVDIFTIRTDDGGLLEVYPSVPGSGQDGIMLRIEPPSKRPPTHIDSVGFDSNRDDELIALAKEILRLAEPCCKHCGRSE